MAKIHAKKSYGQHFLKDEHIAERVAEGLLQAGKTGRVLEVGPGMGMLTKYLLSHAEYETYAVEADRDMVDFLGKNYPDFAPARVVFFGGGNHLYFAGFFLRGQGIGNSVGIGEVFAPWVYLFWALASFLVARP